MTTTTSKTELLLALKSDVGNLKIDLDKTKQNIENVTNTLRTTHRSAFDALKESLSLEIRHTKADITQQTEQVRQFSSTLNSLETKLEERFDALKKGLQDSIEEKIDKLLEGSKEREQSLWQIFTAKSDAYKEQVEQEKKEITDSLNAFLVNRLAEERKVYSELVRQLTEERENLVKDKEAAKQERLVLWECKEVFERENKHKKILEAERARLTEEARTRISPEEEFKMFKKLSKNLEDQRKGFEEERKKMEEERKKFLKKLEEERIQRQERRAMDEERLKLDAVKRLMLDDPSISATLATQPLQTRVAIAQPPYVAPQPVFSPPQQHQQQQPLFAQPVYTQQQQPVFTPQQPVFTQQQPVFSPPQQIFTQPQQPQLQPQQIQPVVYTTPQPPQLQHITQPIQQQRTTQQPTQQSPLEQTTQQSPREQTTQQTVEPTTQPPQQTIPPTKQPLLQSTFVEPTKPKPQQKPTNLSKTVSPISTSEVGRWLQKMGYEEYYPRFISNGFDKLETVALMDMKDIESLEIKLPGHRKGIIAGIQALQALLPDNS